METEDFDLAKVPPWLSLGSCLILAIIYVASLYVWNASENRDHPNTVKKRFLSVTIVMIISPIFIYLFLRDDLTNTKRPIWEMMGFRTTGFYMAFVTPLILTAILFLGPLSAQAVSGVWMLYAEPMYWVNSFRDILWLRNHVVAPLSEEFTFRACMMPLILHTYQPIRAVLINPLFFGVAHLHHVRERYRAGMDMKTIFIVSGVQFLYTSIFGMYSAYLFARTGHFVAPFVAHAFCNHMGFPNIQDVLNQPKPTKHILMALHVIGLVTWIILLPLLTDPTWYYNDMYWHSSAKNITNNDIFPPINTS